MAGGEPWLEMPWKFTLFARRGRPNRTQEAAGSSPASSILRNPLAERVPSFQDPTLSFGPPGKRFGSPCLLCRSARSAAASQSGRHSARGGPAEPLGRRNGQKSLLPYALAHRGPRRWGAVAASAHVLDTNQRETHEEAHQHHRPGRSRATAFAVPAAAPPQIKLVSEQSHSRFSRCSRSGIETCGRDGQYKMVGQDSCQVQNVRQQAAHYHLGSMLRCRSEAWLDKR